MVSWTRELDYNFTIIYTFAHIYCRSDWWHWVSINNLFCIFTAVTALIFLDWLRSKIFFVHEMAPADVATCSAAWLRLVLVCDFSAQSTNIIRQNKWIIRCSLISHQFDWFWSKNVKLGTSTSHLDLMRNARIQAMCISAYNKAFLSDLITVVIYLNIFPLNSERLNLFTRDHAFTSQIICATRAPYQDVNKFMLRPSYHHLG